MRDAGHAAPGAAATGADGLLLSASAPAAAALPDAPRRIAHRWPMLGALSAAEIVSWGVLYYSFAVFVQPLEGDLGWSRTQVTGAFSLALLVSGLAAVPIGHWIDARGTRVLMTAGSVLGIALLVLFSTVRSLPGLYATWAGLGLAMSMVLYEPAFALVAAWFVRERDRALTVLTVCGGLASTLVVPLTTGLVATRGWREAALGLALLLACTSLPIHALVLRDAPAALEQDGSTRRSESSIDSAPGSLRSVLTEARFWCLAVALALASLVGVATTVHLIPYLVGSGMSPAAAAGALGMTGLLQLPGRLAFGPIRRRFSSRGLIAAALVAQAVGLVALMVGTTSTSVAAFVALFGVGAGMATLLRASTLAEVYGLERYGRVSGVVALFTTLGRAAGPLLASLALVASGSYRTVLAELAVLLLVATVVVLVPWRVGPSSSGHDAQAAFGSRRHTAA